MRAIWLVALLLLVLLPSCQSAGQLPDTGWTEVTEMSQALAEIDQLATPAGVDPAVFDELQAELKRVITACHGDKLPAQSPPTGEDVIPAVSLDCDNCISWYLTNPGDYNQDGIVGVSDLTPLGQHFLEEGPFTEDSAAFVVDGNGDGLINVSDITPIGQNFNNTITSYTIYASDNAEDHPRITSGKATSVATAIGSVNVADFSVTPGLRKMLSFSISEHPEAYRWVAPSNGTTEGTPSDAQSGYWQVNSILPDGHQGYRAYGFYAQDLLAVTYVDPVDMHVKYTQATDETGTSWSAPFDISQVAVNDNTYPTGIATVNNTTITYFMGPNLYGRQYTYSSETWGDLYQIWQNPSTSSGGAQYATCQLGTIGDKLYGCVSYDNVIYFGRLHAMSSIYTGTQVSVPSLICDGPHEGAIGFFDDTTYRTMYVDGTTTADATLIYDINWHWPAEWRSKCLGLDPDLGYLLFFPSCNGKLSWVSLDGTYPPQQVWNCLPEYIDNIEYVPGYSTLNPMHIVVIQTDSMLQMLTLLRQGSSHGYVLTSGPPVDLTKLFGTDMTLNDFAIAYRRSSDGASVDIDPILSVKNAGNEFDIVDPRVVRFGAKIEF